jgi:hypothetical protein
MREAASAMRSVTSSTGDEVKALAAARNAIDGALCERLAEMDETRAHESEGASSIATWARRELNQDAATTRQMVRAEQTFRALPSVGEAARAGRIAFGHVLSFTYALKHVGLTETRQLEEPLLDFATSHAPSELHAKIRHIRDVLHSDDLDQAWLRGMEKRDFRLAKTSEGWHVTGFLDTETGAKLKAILDNLSVPRDADDDRTAAQRRMDALEETLDKVLESGLPTDNGVRPHINVTVEAETLKAMAEQEARTDLEPAVLDGFGCIGPQLLAHLLCGAEITPFLIRTIDKNIEVLDVGDTRRRATPRQAKAISLRQQGRCAARGCNHPIAHNHHLVWWSHGGLTDLDNLIGLCRKCHSLVHQGRLDLARGSPRTLAA